MAGILSGLMGGGDEQQGGLLGLLQDPMKQAQLALILKGLSPHSGIDPQQMMVQAQRMKLLKEEQLRDEKRRAEDVAMRREFHRDTLNQQDRQFGLETQRFDASQITPAVKAARDSGLTDPNAPEYQQFIRDWYRDSLAPKTVDIEEQSKKREVIADRLGLKGPQRDSYVATGTMHRGAELSAGDKVAIRKAEDEIPGMESNLRNMEEALRLTPNSYTGFGASTRGQLGAILGGGGKTDPAAVNTRKLDQLMGMSAVERMGDTMKGATTDFEFRKWMALAADLSQPIKTREGALTEAIRLYKDEINVRKTRINELRGGDYYKPGGGSSGTVTSPSRGDRLPDPLGLR
jgi:hypothetical protein